MAPPGGPEQRQPDPNEQLGQQPEGVEQKEEKKAPSGNPQAAKEAQGDAAGAGRATTELQGKVNEVDKAAEDAGVTLPAHVRELQGITAKVEAPTIDKTTVEAAKGHISEMKEQRKSLVEDELNPAKAKLKEAVSSLHTYVQEQRAAGKTNDQITKQDGYKPLIEQHSEAKKVLEKTQDEIHGIHTQEIKEARELKDREDPPKNAVEGHMRDMSDAMKEFKTAKTFGEKIACFARALGAIMAAAQGAPHKSVGKTPEIQSKSKRREELKKDIKSKGSLRECKEGKSKELKEVQGKIQLVNDAETGLGELEGSLQTQEADLEAHKAKEVPADPAQAAEHNEQTATLTRAVEQSKEGIDKAKMLISQREDLQKQEEALKKDIDELTEWEGEVKKNAERATASLKGMAEGGQGKLNYLGEVAVKPGADGISLEWEIKPDAEMHLRKALGEGKYKELVGEDPSSVKDSAALGVELQGLLLKEVGKEEEEEGGEGEQEGVGEKEAQAAEISHEDLPQNVLDTMQKYIPDEDIPGFEAKLLSLDSLQLDVQHPGGGKVTMEVSFKNPVDGRGNIVKRVEREWKTGMDTSPSHEQLAHYDAIASVLYDAIRADRMAKMGADSA